MKEFQEKHLKLRDLQRTEDKQRLAGRSQSPKIQSKQELQKLRELANKYTINKKEWVLNAFDERSQSYESE